MDAPGSPPPRRRRGTRLVIGLIAGPIGLSMITTVVAVALFGDEGAYRIKTPGTAAGMTRSERGTR